MSTSTSSPAAPVRGTARSLEGTVVSASMQKTIVVRVTRTKTHPVYKKRFTVSRTYHVHDEAGAYRVGDAVRFVECRPLSRTKRWRAIPKAQ